MFQTAPCQQVPSRTRAAAAPSRDRQSQRSRPDTQGPPRLPAGFTSAYAGFSAQTRAPPAGGGRGLSAGGRAAEPRWEPTPSPPRAPQRAPPAPRERRPRQAPLAVPGEGSGTGTGPALRGLPRLGGAAAALTAPGAGGGSGRAAGAAEPSPGAAERRRPRCLRRSGPGRAGRGGAGRERTSAGPPWRVSRGEPEGGEQLEAGSRRFLSKLTGCNVAVLLLLSHPEGPAPPSCPGWSGAGRGGHVCYHISV